MFNRASAKRNARYLTKTAKPNPIFAGLLYIALSIVAALLSSRLTNAFTYDELSRYMQYVLDGHVEQAWYMMEAHIPPLSAQLIDLALHIVTYIVSVGLVIFLLNTIRSAGACFGNLLDGFGMVWRLLVLEFFKAVFVALWSMLFVIPGLIAAYRYRMALYLLIDHPELSPLDCIRESKRMMAGHKAELFVLDLSFIGWEFLSAIPYVGYAVMVWTVPYMEMTFAMYYEWRCGRPIPDSLNALLDDIIF